MGIKNVHCCGGVPGQTFLLTAVVQFATSIVGATLTIILLVFVLSGIAG